MMKMVLFLLDIIDSVIFRHLNAIYQLNFIFTSIFN